MQPQFIEFLKYNYSNIPDNAAPKIGHVLYIYSDQERDFSKTASVVFSIFEQSYQNQFSAVQFVKGAIRSAIKRMFNNFKKLKDDESRESYAGKEFRLPGSSFIATETHSNADEKPTPPKTQRLRNSSSASSHADSDLSRVQQDAIASPENDSSVKRNSTAASEASRSLRDRLKLKRSSSNSRTSLESSRPVENGLSSELEGLSPTFSRSVRRSTEAQTKASLGALKISKAKDAEEEEAHNSSSRTSTPKRSPIKSPIKNQPVASDEKNHINNVRSSPASSDSGERTTDVAKDKVNEAEDAADFRFTLLSAETGVGKKATVEPAGKTEEEIPVDESRNDKAKNSQGIHDTEAVSEEFNDLEPMDCDQSGDLAIMACWTALEPEKEHEPISCQNSLKSRLNHESFESSRTNSFKSTTSELRDKDQASEQKRTVSNERSSVKESGSPQRTALERTCSQKSSLTDCGDEVEVHGQKSESGQVNAVAEIERDQVNSLATTEHVDQVNDKEETESAKVNDHEKLERAQINLHEKAGTKSTNTPKGVEPKCVKCPDSLEVEAMEVDEDKEKEEEEPSPAVTRRRSSRVTTSAPCKTRTDKTRRDSVERTEKEDLEVAKETGRDEKTNGRKMDMEAAINNGKRKESSKKASNQGKKNAEKEEVLETPDKKMTTKGEQGVEGSSKKKSVVTKAKLGSAKSEAELDSDEDLEDFVTAPTLRSSKKKSGGRKDTHSSRLTESSNKMSDEKKSDRDRSKSKSASKSDDGQKRRESDEKSTERNKELYDANETPRSSRNREKKRLLEDRKESEVSETKSASKLNSSKVFLESDMDEKDDFVTPRSSRNREHKKNTQEEKDRDSKTKTTVKPKDTGIAKSESETEKKEESVSTTSPRLSRSRDRRKESLEGKEKEDCKKKTLKPKDIEKSTTASDEDEERGSPLLLRSSRSKDHTKNIEGKRESENSRTGATPRSSISETKSTQEEEFSISVEALRSSRFRERKSESGENKKNLFIVKATHFSSVSRKRKQSENEVTTANSADQPSDGREKTKNSDLSTPKSKPSSGKKSSVLDNASKCSSEKDKRKEKRKEEETEEHESSSEDETPMPRRSQRVSEIERRIEKKPPEPKQATIPKEGEASVASNLKSLKEKEEANPKSTGGKEKGEGKSRLSARRDSKEEEVPLKRRREEAVEEKEEEKRRSSRRKEPMKVKEEPEEVETKSKYWEKSAKDRDEVFARRSFRLVERRSMIEFGPPPEIIAAAAAAAGEKDELASKEEREDSVSTFEAPQLRKRPRSQAGETETASSGSTVAAVVEKESEPRAKRRRRNRAAKEAAESEEEAEAESDSDVPRSPAKRTSQRKTAEKLKKQRVSKEETDEDSEEGEDDEMEEEEEESEEEKKGEQEEYFEFQRLYAAGWARRDPVCPLCEKKAEAGEELLACCGGCHQHYHRRCADRHLRNLTAPPVPDGATPSTTRTPSRHESESTVDGEQESSFRCPECRLGRRRCFLCKEEQADETAPLIRCAVSSCGQMYHEACLRAMTFTRQDSRGLLVCPLHLCHACAIDNPASRTVRQGRMLRCIRCPVSYHAGDFCVAAGSTELSGAYIVCPNHFETNLMKRYRTINVLWCLICSKGGSLICCEKCPASFHTECIDVERDSIPEKFVCDDCAQGRNPRYGEIIWSKVGHFRWWPCEVLHPRNAPKNIKKLTHYSGQFPIHFFGSDEYCWIHRGRVFSFEGDDYKELKHDDETGSRLERWYTKGIKKAVRAARAWREEREEREERQDSKKPYPYKYIKTNYPIGGVKIYKPGEMHEVQRCDCRPANGKTGAVTCGSDSDCLNRMLMYECSPALCRGGEMCQNQRFVQRQYPPQEIFKTDNLRGWGLRTQADIKKGDFVNEYVGDLIDEDESMRRLMTSHESNVTNYYMLTLDRARMIDAGPKGNLSRFMNHSCEPTLETQKWLVNGDFRIGLFALRDIKKGEELTFNYNFQSLGDEAITCRCGAPSCKGFLGAPTAAQARRQQLEEPQAPPPPPSKGARRSQGAKQGPGGTGKGKRPAALPKRDSEASLQSLDVGEPAGSTASSTADSSEGGPGGKGGKKRARNGRGRKSGRTEDFCFRCGEGGDLVPCNAERCPKSYHLPCLGLDRFPAGLWFCPWHHCDECGRAASLMCSECTTSYCESHLLPSGANPEPMFRLPTDPNVVFCRDHEDLIAQFSNGAKTKPEKGKENTTPPRDQASFEVAASA